MTSEGGAERPPKKQPRQRNNTVAGPDGVVTRLGATSVFRTGLSSIFSERARHLLPTFRAIADAVSRVKYVASCAMPILITRLLAEVEAGAATDRVGEIKSWLVTGSDEAYKCMLYAIAGKARGAGVYAGFYDEMAGVLRDDLGGRDTMGLEGSEDVPQRVYAYLAREVKTSFLNSTREDPGLTSRMCNWVRAEAFILGASFTDRPIRKSESRPLVDALHKTTDPIFKDGSGRVIPPGSQRYLDLMMLTERCRTLAPSATVTRDDDDGEMVVKYDTWELLCFWGRIRPKVVNDETTKGFDIFPIFHAKQHFITIDSSCIATMLKGVKADDTIKHFKEHAYNIFDPKKLRSILRHDRDMHKLGVTFTTDGVQVHLQLIHDFKLRGKTFNESRVENDDVRLDPDLFEIVGVDPGENAILTAHNIDAPEGYKDNDFSISKGGWRCMRGSSDHAKAIAALKVCSEVGRSAGEAEGELSEASGKRAATPDQLVEAGLVRLACMAPLRRFYASMAATRRKFALDMRKQKALDLVADRLLTPADKTKRVVLAYGNGTWSRSGMKGLPPGPINTIKDHIMRKHGEVLSHHRRVQDVEDMFAVPPKP